MNRQRLFFALLLCILTPLAAMASDDILRRLAEADSLYFTPGSPTECEAAFASVLREALESDAITDPTERSIAEWKLSVCLTNAEDSVATDLLLRRPVGDDFTLLDYVASEPVLMLLYDPNCHHCREVIQSLQAPGLLPTSLRVLAVCIEGDPNFWMASIGGLIPDGWDNAYDMSGVLENDLYIVRSMPSVYLINPGGIVALKNPSIKRLTDYFTKCQ